MNRVLSFMRLTTERVIQESLRLYPPAWTFSRQAVGKDEIGGFEIPPNSVMLISPYLIHRHAQFWLNPEGFDPDRFEDRAIAERPRFAYLPFGGGPRACIGNGFAMTEMMIVLAMISQKFRLHLSAEQPVEMAPLLTLKPKYGMRMTLYSVFN